MDNEIIRRLPFDLAYTAERIVLFSREENEKFYMVVVQPETKAQRQAGITAQSNPNNEGEILVYSAYNGTAPRKEIFENNSFYVTDKMMFLFISLIQDDYKISLLKDRYGIVLKPKYLINILNLLRIIIQNKHLGMPKHFKLIQD